MLKLKSKTIMHALKTITRKIYLTPSFIALSSCSTVPIQPPSVQGPAIIFVRDNGFFGAGCTFNVIVDGELVGKLSAGKSVVKTVSTGRHKAGIDNNTAMCTNVKMIKVVEVSEEPVVLRVGITSNSQVIFDQTE